MCPGAIISVLYSHSATSIQQIEAYPNISCPPGMLPVSILLALNQPVEHKLRPWYLPNTSGAKDHVSEIVCSVEMC